MADSAIMDLARAAHEFWRRRRIAEGWRHAPTFDAARRTHDALVPFDQLPEPDRVWTIRCLEVSGLPDVVANEIDYPRGPDRPFTLVEMKKGLHVLSAGPERERGEVVSWDRDESGRLSVIRVRWEDGDTTEHDPWARELARDE